MIRCDFCDAPCMRMVTAGPRESRRFTCDEHREEATSQEPIDKRNDYLRVQDIDAAEAIWRADIKARKP